MNALFHTPTFKVYISDLADYLGIDGMASPEYKVSRSKMLVWRMEVNAFQNCLNSIEFKADSVKFDFNWFVEEKYLEERDANILRKMSNTTTFKGELSGWAAIDASAANGWSIDFMEFDLRNSCGYEKIIDEVEVSLTEKTILIR